MLQHGPVVEVVELVQSVVLLNSREMHTHVEVLASQCPLLLHRSTLQRAPVHCFVVSHTHALPVPVGSRAPFKQIGSQTRVAELYVRAR